ncbi:type I secretion system permease/ATPase [Caenimonas koreensis]|uniref:Type I secretion system permease/ATPase n=1 Tax=Caenimonas koreensis DSM 17982 TaxID=1121255 RepID=A0A844B227_9BURK|nr:type I secretion system permease/ATPase [Caenimonas koreensis]MRD47243.1 type I secretion system permease/ATPase [Caenimonas koreensis DSM 17982]
MKQPSFFERSELTQALWAFRREFYIVALFSFVSNLLMLAPTIYMLQIYDRVMVSRSELTLLAVSLITLFLFGIMAISDWSRSRVLVRAGVRFDEQLSTRVFNSSFESYLSQSSASPSRSFSDLLTIRQFLTGQGIYAFFDAPWAPIYIIVIFFLQPVLGWLALFFACVQGLQAWFGHRHTVKPSEAAQAAGMEVSSYLQSKLRNAEVIESMGMLDSLRARWRKLQLGWLGQTSESQGVVNRVQAWSKLLRYSQQSISLGVGALLVIHGDLSPGGMIASNMLMTRALSPIDQLVSTWRMLAMTRAAFDRLEKLLQQYPERDPNLSRVAPNGSMQLRDVVATATGRETPILKGVSFEVQAGTVTAILGPSGSGKSTLARVMVGIWPEVSGEVLIDGLPINGWNRVELGPHLGYLPQDIELFEGSIADNIARFGAADSDKIIEAARCAGLHEMILRFPKGYDTSIGEAGGMLSGGQRQRIGLARAVYGNPRVIVLDEPNSNLDDAGEASLVRTIKQLKQEGRTVFLITHRGSIVSVADRVMVLKDGEIKVDGAREQVMAALRPPPKQQPPQAGVPQPA